MYFVNDVFVSYWSTTPRVGSLYPLGILSCKFAIAVHIWVGMPLYHFKVNENWLIISFHARLVRCRNLLGNSD